MRGRRSANGWLVGIGAWAAGLVLASTAAAHGPTIDFGRDKLEPKEIHIEVGEIVHFHNLDFMPGGMKVRAVDGSFESPALGRNQGWHHAFKKAGVYEFEVVGFGQKGRVVVEKDEGGGHASAHDDDDDGDDDHDHEAHDH